MNEYRTGSSNLIKWFSLLPNFTAWVEPSKPTSPWYQGLDIEKYSYPTEHLITKDDFNPFFNVYDDMIKYSDKQIFLYRENYQEHLESWLYANKAGHWLTSYTYKYDHTEYELEQEKIFYDLKKSFYNRYLSNSELFKVSYEELYYHKTGLQKIIDYIELDIKTEGFPVGEKYRIYNNEPETLNTLIERELFENLDYNFLDQECKGLPFPSKVVKKKKNII